MAKTPWYKKTPNQAPLITGILGLIGTALIAAAALWGSQQKSAPSGVKSEISIVVPNNNGTIIGKQENNFKPKPRRLTPEQQEKIAKDLLGTANGTICFEIDTQSDDGQIYAGSIAFALKKAGYSINTEAAQISAGAGEDVFVFSYTSPEVQKIKNALSNAGIKISQAPRSGQMGVFPSSHRDRNLIKITIGRNTTE
jgi:hypothetical protein